MTVPMVSKSVMSAASATVKPRTGTHSHRDRALVVDSAYHPTVALRLTSAS